MGQIRHPAYPSFSFSGGASSKEGFLIRPWSSITPSFMHQPSAPVTRRAGLLFCHSPLTVTSLASDTRALKLIINHISLDSPLNTHRVFPLASLLELNLPLGDRANDSGLVFACPSGVKF